MCKISRMSMKFFKEYTDEKYSYGLGGTSRTRSSIGETHSTGERGR
jgi:hypothetical protein